ncbi:CDP-diacylglycerol--glycerol-3-phosphate 3-phosphatidyltransferase [Halobacteriovorax marinus]|uniref:CDP-diacylglycerol--glycerol-3-phosphate 3-phosphatidyltransferase n=1 Tax=Halobacteriovorax marinus TaxID=97084 RepID=UPI000BC363FC|nr:CDP-diacylglycerol--glycerol-3-phosphate 3-phosphatidyltransferase [Halobacteriovorax marinus]ATH07752.1 CDP-diacylglycerol--glycerol-3-phosphate 3-phosphatidyltransferase [Halobacteriovorax marinus]
MTSNNNEWDIDNLPNRLTIFRVLLIPIIVTSILLILSDFKTFEPYHYHLGYLAAWTFVAASITDFFDGYIARKRGIVTVFGSFLDPIADKFLVVSSLILLQALGRIPALLVIILVLREIYITALRLLAMEKGFKVPVDNSGKWKTALQMVSIPMLFAFDHPFGIPFPALGTAFIYIAALLSLYSACFYSFNTMKKLKSARNEAKTQRIKEKSKGEQAEAFPAPGETK